MLSTLYSIARPSVRQTGISVKLKNGWSSDYAIFTVRWPHPSSFGRICLIQKFWRVPQSGASNKAGWVKQRHFLALCANILKTVQDIRQKLLEELMANATSIASKSWMILNCEVWILSKFRVISQIWEAAMAKRMKIKPYCLRQNCSPVNVLFSYCIDTAEHSSAEVYNQNTTAEMFATFNLYTW